MIVANPHSDPSKVFQLYRRVCGLCPIDSQMKVKRSDEPMEAGKRAHSPAWKTQNVYTQFIVFTFYEQEHIQITVRILIHTDFAVHPTSSSLIWIGCLCLIPVFR